MRDATLIGTGAVGAVIAVVCCATPVLVIALGTVGLAAVAAYLDFVLLPAFAVCLGLIGYGLYMRRQAAARCAAKTGEKRNV
jgi:mercuric ion transport protein